MSDWEQELEADLGTRYQLVQRLGQGGTAIVFLARDLKHDRHVAIKVLRREIANGATSRRFQREIALVTRLTHPNILTLIDSGEAAGVPYFVMPYVEGETLAARLDRERQLPVAEAVRLACEIADALEYAHVSGVVHRDVKPGNILLVAQHAVVADFGAGWAAQLAATDTSHTQTGIVIGTLAYMSPEQGSGESNLDGRTDQYSLGVVVHEMLAGALPFSGPNARAIMARRFVMQPPPLRELRPDIPTHVERAVLRAMAADPNDRFPSIAAFAAALQAGPDTSERPAAAHRKAAGQPSGPRLGRLVSKTCDRLAQVNAFDAFVRTNRKARPGCPQVFIVHGEEGQGHESLVERLVGTTVTRHAEELGGVERGCVTVLRVPWPEADDLDSAQRDLAVSLFREADPYYLDVDMTAARLGERLGAQLSSVIVLQHDIRIKHWRPHTRQLLQWYTDHFWGAAATPRADQQILVFLKIIYAPPATRQSIVGAFLRGRQARIDKRRVARELEMVFAGTDRRCACMMFKELSPVSVDDVKDWFDSNRIYDSERKRHEIAEAIFGGIGMKRMADVEDALEQIHRTFVTEHARSGGGLSWS